MKALLETWSINNRMNKLLLSGISKGSLTDVGSAKGRSVGEQFAHIHNVRLMWIKASAPDLLKDQHKLEKEEAASATIIISHLDTSARAIEALLELGFSTGRIKGFKPHPEAFLGYLISHESHHRGQIIITLKENNHMPDKKILYGLWEWGVH